MLAGGDVKKVIDDTDPEEFLEMGMDEALKLIDKLAENGTNLRGFVERCVEVLRDKLLETRDVGLIGKIEGLEKAYERMKTSAVAQLPLEIFVIENMTNSKPQTPGHNEVPKTKPQILNTPPPAVSPPKLGGEKLEDVLLHWPEVMAAVKPKNHSVEALLRSTRPVDFDGRDLVLEAFYEFHKKQLESERCRVIVEQAVGEVLGAAGIVLKLQLGSGPKKMVVAEDELVKAAEEIFK